MFRFTIRELLLLTLIVGLGLGWALRERHWRVEIERAAKWRLRAGALEKAFDELGYRVEWDSVTVTAWNKNDNTGNAWVATDQFEPSYRE